MQRICIKELRRFCNRHFKLDNLVSSLTDHRKYYEIPMSHIIYTLLYTTIINENTFLAKDKIARKKYFKNFIKSKRRMVVSDTTLERNLRGNINNKELLSISLEIIKSVDNDLFINDKIKKRCLIFDGSGVSKKLNEFCFIPGKIDLFLESLPISKKGKELPVSYNLIKNISETFGRDSFDLMFFDGLYYSNNLFKTVKENFNAEVLIKTRENLVIIQEAEEIIKHYKNCVETVIGFDDEKLCSYEICIFNNVKAPTIDYPLKLAVINESYKYKNGSGEKDSHFYEITSDLSLSAEDMRDAGHLRWKIENNGFKRMNHLFQSKRKYSWNGTFIKNYLLILFIAYNILQIFLLKTKKEMKNLVGKIVFKDWIKILYESLVIEYSDLKFHNSG